jgi:hypothetical protein
MGTWCWPLTGAKGGGLLSGLDLEQLRAGFEEKFFPQLQTLQAALPYICIHGSVTFITAVSAQAKARGTGWLGAINGALELMVPVLAKDLKTVTHQIPVWRLMKYMLVLQGII